MLVHSYADDDLHHHSLFLLIFGIQKLLLLKLCKGVILRCLSNFRQHLKLIGDVYLLFFEFYLSGFGVGPLSSSECCRGGGGSAAGRAPGAMQVPPAPRRNPRVRVRACAGCGVASMAALAGVPSHHIGMCPAVCRDMWRQR